MGRTVEELETSMSIREFHEWIAMANLDAADEAAQAAKGRAGAG